MERRHLNRHESVVTSGRYPIKTNGNAGSYAVSAAAEASSESTAAPRNEGDAFLQQDELIYHHEAGHAVAKHLYDFRPKWIRGATTDWDRRSTSLFRNKNRLLETPRSRERAEDFVVTCIAGIAAESRISKVPLSALRGASGQSDYEKVYAIADYLTALRGFEYYPAVQGPLILYWEAQAIALMQQPDVWSAVEHVVAELRLSRGVLEGAALIGTIRRGLDASHKPGRPRILMA